MTTQQAEKTALQIYLFTLAVFVLMQMLVVASGGTAAQEINEVFAPAATYGENLAAGGNLLRSVLLLDLFFMIGYGGALGMTAYANAGRNLVLAWVAGIGIALLVLLDVGENTIMVISLDMLAAGGEVSPARIGWQAGISSAKWLMAALSVVALTFTLPQNTGLERLLVWAARVLLPLGVGLFTTGAFDMREVGGLFILAGMVGGFSLLAITIRVRLRG